MLDFCRVYIGKGNEELVVYSPWPSELRDVGNDRDNEAEERFLTLSR